VSAQIDNPNLEFRKRPVPSRSDFTVNFNLAGAALNFRSGTETSLVKLFGAMTVEKAWRILEWTSQFVNLENKGK
jgi:hypothetical protein